MAKFEQALKAMREGKKVKIKDWIGEYLYIENGELRGYNYIDKRSNIHPLLLSEIMSEDWEVVE